MSAGRVSTIVAALAFVREHGVVLESARGPVPSLAAEVAGGPVRGSWWGHPESHRIFAVTRAVRDAEEVHVCRVVEGRITYVHERLWPALVRAAGRFPRARLARIREVHAPDGRHVVEETAFPEWVPGDVRLAARRLSEAGAVAALGPWCA